MELSPGDAPGSEPETQALLGLIQELNPDWIVTLHARLACVDDPLGSPLAKGLAWESELPLVAEIGYPTPGSLGSWALEQKRILITYELPDISIVSSRRRFTRILERLLCDDLPVTNQV